MASYQSQARQFSTYTPEVNAEMYGALLNQHEQQYQQGVQKIDQQLDQVASLPVSNPAERDYLQQKISAVTSELNQNINTDWSNQAMQKMTNKHISTIAGDHNIQTAIYNSSVIKREAEKKQNDIDKYGEGAVSDNMNAFDEDYSQWYSSGKLGQRVDGVVKYTPYINLDEGVRKYLKDLHPKSEVYEDTSGSGRDDQYDIKKYEVSGIDPTAVRKEIAAYFGTTPGAFDQISVSAKARYKNFNAASFAIMKGTVAQQQVGANKAEIEQMILMQAKVSDSAMKSKLTDRITALRSENESLMPGDRYDPSRDVELFNSTDDSTKQQLYQQLYQQQFTNGIVDMYSYGGTYKVTSEGKSPWEKSLEREKFGMQKEEFSIKKEEHSLEMQIKQAKLNGVHSAGEQGAGWSTKLPIAVEDKDSVYSGYEREVVQAGLDVNQQQIDFLANTYKVKGGIDIDKYFTKDDNGRWIIKNGTIANTGATFKEYFMSGWTDDNGTVHKGVINDWQEKAAKADYFKDDKGWNLTNSDVQTLREMNLRNSEYQAGLNEITSMGKKADSSPLAKEYNGILDKYNKQPHAVTLENGTNIQISGVDINNAINALQQTQKRVSEQLGTTPTSDAAQYEYQQQAKKIREAVFANYPGLTSAKVDAMERSNVLSTMLGKYDQVATDRKNILNKEAKDRGYVFQPVQVTLTKNASKEAGTDYINQSVYDKLKSYLDANGGIDKYKNFSSVITSNDEGDKPQVTMTWNPGSQKYTFNVFTTKGKSEAIQMSAQDAAAYNFPDIRPTDDHLFRIMKGYGGHTNPPGQAMVFENAQPLATLGDLEYRVHVIDRGGDYVIQPYRVNTAQKGKPETLSDIVVRTRDWGVVSKKLQSIIKGSGLTNLINED